MAGVLLQCAGRVDEFSSLRPLRFSAELARVTQLVMNIVGLCVYFSTLRTGLSGASLRQVLQASDEVLLRRGSPCRGRLSQHDIDLVTSKSLDCPIGPRRRSSELRGAYALLSVMPLIDMLLEIGRRCGERDPALVAVAPLDRLEWLLGAIRPAARGSACPTAGTSMATHGSASWPALTPSGSRSRLPRAFSRVGGKGGGRA